jgi:hypothetical protein
MDKRLVRETAVFALVGGLFFLPAFASAESAVCSILSPVQVSSIIGAPVGSGVAITRSDPAAPGAIGHACAYLGESRSVVLGLYRGSSAQLARIKQINEHGGSVTAMHGNTLVSVLVTDTSSGARTPDRAASKKLLAAAISKL